MDITEVIETYLGKKNNSESLDEKFELNVDNYKSIDDISNDLQKSFSKVSAK